MWASHFSKQNSLILTYAPTCENIKTFEMGCMKLMSCFIYVISLSFFCCDYEFLLVTFMLWYLSRVILRVTSINFGGHCVLLWV